MCVGGLEAGSSEEPMALANGSSRGGRISFFVYIYIYIYMYLCLCRCIHIFYIPLSLSIYIYTHIHSYSSSVTAHLLSGPTGIMP